MDASTFGRSGVIARIMELDDALSGRIRAHDRIPLVIVGSAALLLVGLADEDRVTQDIHLIEAPFEALPSMGQLDMNNAAETFLLRLPSGWRDGTKRVDLPTDIVDVRIPSPADLAIMKFDSGRDQDLKDVETMVGREPTLRNDISKLLSDPLEMQINVAEGDWSHILENWSDICDRDDARNGGLESGSNESLSEAHDRRAHSLQREPVGRARDKSAGLGR